MTWEGTLESANAGNHKFQLYGSSYFKVFVDDKLVLDRWRQNWAAWYHNFDVADEGRQAGRRSGSNGFRTTATSRCCTTIRCRTPSVIRSRSRRTSAAPSTTTSSRADTQDEVIARISRAHRQGGDDAALGLRFLAEPPALHDAEGVAGRGGGIPQAQDPARQHRAGLVLLEGRPVGLARVRQDAFSRSRRAWSTKLHAHERAVHDLRVAEVLSRPRPTTRSSTPPGSCTTATSKRARKTGWARATSTRSTTRIQSRRATCTGARCNEKLNVLGIDAWWMDATEPDVHSNLDIDSHQGAHRPDGDGPGGSVLQLLSAGAHRRRVRRLAAGRTRTSACSSSRARAFAGIQRNAAAVWSGDIVSRWDDLYNQISAGVSIGYSGLPNWTFDIGGFANESRYSTQQADRRPISRNGASSTCAGSSSARSRRCSARTANFRSARSSISRRRVRRCTTASCGTTSCATACCPTPTRSRRTPSIATARSCAACHGLRRTTRPRANVRDEYLFGKAFLVAPVHKYKARSRQVYLPAGADWYDFHTGAQHAGGQSVEAAAPLARMPLYVRAGSIVPVGPGHPVHARRSPARRSRCSCSRAPTAASTTTKTTA